jgi:hypothetical protein
VRKQPWSWTNEYVRHGTQSLLAALEIASLAHVKQRTPVNFLPHPQLHFHYTPTHYPGLTIVECFFSILGKQGLSQSVHTSKRHLKEFLLNYITQNNKNPKPFVWTKGPEGLQRIIEVTKEYQAAHPRKLRKGRCKAHSVKN